jgi:hypothetical protein
MLLDPVLNLPPGLSLDQENVEPNTAMSTGSESDSVITEADSTMDRDLSSQSSVSSISDSIFDQQILQRQLQKQREVSKHTIQALYVTKTNLVPTDSPASIIPASGKPGDMLCCPNGTDLVITNSDAPHSWIFRDHGQIESAADSTIVLSCELPPFMIGSGITGRYRVQCMRKMELDLNKNENISQRWVVVDAENGKRFIVCASNTEFVLARDGDNIILERKMGNYNDERFHWQFNVENQ